MDRRTFLAIATAVLTAPLAAEAQQPGKVYRVGVLWRAEGPEAEAPFMRALSAGLRERGYVEGQNIVLEHRFPAEVPERFKTVASELVILKPDVALGLTIPPSILLRADKVIE